MGLAITIEIKGDKQAISRLKKLGHTLLNFEDAMKEIGGELKKYYGNQAYASQGGVFNDKWPRLSPRYAAWKAKHYPGAGPLIRTGTMKNSYVFESDRDSVTITNDAPQFKYHQSTAPRHKIPRRATIGVNQDVRTIVQNIIDNDIREKMKKAGIK